MKTIRRNLTLMMAFGTLVTMSACDSGDARPSMDAMDIGPATDLLVDAGEPDSGYDPGYYNPDVPHDTLQLQPVISSPSIRFEMAGRDGKTVLINLVARDLGQVYGIALQVEFPAADFAFDGMDMEALFGTAGTQALYLADVMAPGRLAVGMTHLGSGKEKEKNLEGDVKIAVLRLLPTTGKEGTLSFFEPRCLTVGRKLDKVEADYLPALVYP
ncbi:MAG: hypothetical protein ISR64_07735 [Deltaproteobacteria bacterium]|nr:hypothetical protein [Deltaproteobacteria bacterium]